MKLPKRRPALDASQLGFTFDPPSRPAREAGLAGLGRRVSAAVGHAVKGDERAREEIAAAMSVLLDEHVTRSMIDSWSAESKDQNPIGFARFMALITVTNRFDLLDALVREAGVAVLVGDELLLARLGDVRSRIRALHAEEKSLNERVLPKGGRRG